jgi:hypothetical protein
MELIYRIKEPHRAAKDAWLAGVAGPYPVDGPVGSGAPGTFSRFESYDSKSSEKHVRTTHHLVVERRKRPKRSTKDVAYGRGQS